MYDNYDEDKIQYWITIMDDDKNIAENITGYK